MLKHTLLPPSDGSIPPLRWYEKICESPEFIYDSAQASTVRELDHLWHQLIDFKHKRNQFLGRSFLSPNIPQGLYIFGGVGRGKSFLMDVFYTSLPYKRKRRVHFHQFMNEVHREMKILASSKDPLIALANKISSETRLLCFDEFHVNDIADAMILGRLMKILFEQGVVMVMTSNIAPDELYANGLQRQKFLPAIALINKKLKVIQIDSGNDYRLRAVPEAPLLMALSDSDSVERMNAIFNRLSTAEVKDNCSIEILGRKIPVKKISAQAVWFDFKDICGGPRAKEDYLEIAGQYSIVFITGIPQMGPNQSAEIQRFIWLIDILYDQHVKLVATSAASVNELCLDVEKSKEFLRTASRLTEMQTQPYLDLPVQNLHRTVTHSPL